MSFNKLKSFIPVMALLAAGCTSTALKNPVEMAAPARMQCIQIDKSVEAHELKGILNIPWTTRLAAGAYISEYEDDEAIYFRAPTGGVYIGRDDVGDKPAGLLTFMNYDGGIKIPKAANAEIQVYTYFTTESVPVPAYAEERNCSNARYLKSPDAKGVSAVAFTVGGATGGATGGALAARANGTSVGRAAGVGAVGGAVGGLIVAAMINRDVGKLVTQAPSTDKSFSGKLSTLASQRSTILPATPNTQKD